MSNFAPRYPEPGSDEQVGRSYTHQTIIARLSAFFGLVAVFLSSIGLYGISLIWSAAGQVKSGFAWRSAPIRLVWIPSDHKPSQFLDGRPSGRHPETGSGKGDPLVPRQCSLTPEGLSPKRRRERVLFRVMNKARPEDDRVAGKTETLLRSG